MNKLVEGVGAQINIRISEVPAIPLTASGKRRVTIRDFT